MQNIRNKWKPCGNNLSVIFRTEHANYSSIFSGFEHQFKTSSKVLELSMKILKSGGKYLARVRSFNNERDK